MDEIPPLVVDANVIVSGVLKNGVTRRLLADPRLRLYAPQHLWEEIDGVVPILHERSGMARDRIEALFEMFRARILIVPAPLVQRNLAVAEERLREGDLDDAPYLATAFAIRGSLWTHDKSFRDRAGVPSVGTADLLRSLG